MFGTMKRTAEAEAPAPAAVRAHDIIEEHVGIIAI